MRDQKMGSDLCYVGGKGETGTGNWEQDMLATVLVSPFPLHVSPWFL